jgi:hypothetical protein
MRRCAIVQRAILTISNPAFTSRNFASRAFISAVQGESQH